MQTHRRILDMEMSQPPPYGNRTSEFYIGATRFDTNMVIILAVLLCALIFALGLNTIVRCVLRCFPTLSSETLNQTHGRGLKKQDLRQIPVAVYGKSGKEIPATECPICLGEFADGEKVRVLPKCHHQFHVRCIDTWLLSHSSCPNCRLSLLEKATSSAVAEAVP